MFLKTVYPSALYHQIPFVHAVDNALKAGFSGYWFLPSLDFNISKEEMLSLIQNKHILPMGMELPVEFRESEEVFLKDLSRLDEVAEYAEYIGVRRAVTWILPFSDTLTYRENFELHVERLRKILSVLSKHSISLGLEFQGPKTLRKDKRYSFIHTLDGLMGLISAIDMGNVGLLMDVWHFYHSGSDLLDFSLINGNDVICVHISDAPNGISMCDMEDQKRTLPASTGRLDIKTFLRELDRIGYSGPVIVEPFDSTLSALSTGEAFSLASASLDKVL